MKRIERTKRINGYKRNRYEKVRNYPSNEQF